MYKRVPHSFELRPGEHSDMAGGAGNHGTYTAEHKLLGVARRCCTVTKNAEPLTPVFVVVFFFLKDDTSDRHILKLA